MVCCTQSQCLTCDSLVWWLRNWNKSSYLFANSFSLSNTDWGSAERGWRSWGGNEPSPWKREGRREGRGGEGRGGRGREGREMRW